MLDGVRNGYETIDLPAFCKAIGLTYGYAFGNDDLSKCDVIFADQYGLALGYDAQMMAKLYNCMDVHLLVTMGEGFGIPLIEAQACGAPVITGDWTAMSELCFSGYKVDKAGADMVFTPNLAFQYVPRPAAIAEKLERAYRNRGVERYRKWATEAAQEYGADNVTEKYWLPTLARIEQKIADAPVSSVLAQNLAMLRTV
jgi:glycosyltransferase involved in cell wall biosynthesis